MQTVIGDCEVYRNYFLAAFEGVETGNVVTIEKRPGQPFDAARLEKIVTSCRTVGFNWKEYDLTVIYLAIRGRSCAEIKEASDRMIVGGERSWQVLKPYGIYLPRNLDFIDLIEVAPGQASLKIYGGRLHAHRMQDLPIDPSADLTDEEIEATRLYCVNDLSVTKRLFHFLQPQLELRSSMSKQYGQDLRSKSDAQIAEAVIKKRVEDLVGAEIKRPTIEAGTTYRYAAPEYLRFDTWQMQDALGAVIDAPFVVGTNGSIILPPEIEKLKISLGGSVYRMGIGGLHSSEETVAHFSDEHFSLIDRDVASYYPEIIRTLGLYPKHMGGDFLKVYSGIVDRRLKAKDDVEVAAKAGDEVAERQHQTVADSLKITINGSFGKFGSKWSSLYSPNLLIQTTMTGQLALLMLIERIELAGISVVSANTDGLVIKCPRDREDDLLAIVAQWETDTGFSTEETRYAALFSRDVNNYIAVYEKPKKKARAKFKGAYAPPGLMKNPTNQICVTAAIAHIMDGTPLEETIVDCDDFTQFVTVRAVKGGAVYGDRYLGKAVRWYYGRGSQGCITYKSNGTKVARSDGAVPAMDLPDEMPNDIDYDWYIAEAQSILTDVGFFKRIVPFNRRQLYVWSHL